MFCRRDLKHIRLYICTRTSCQCLCKCAGTHVRERTAQHLGERQCHITQDPKVHRSSHSVQDSVLTWACCPVCIQHVSVMTHAKVRESVVNTDVLAVIISPVARGWTWGGETLTFKTGSSKKPKSHKVQRLDSRHCWHARWQLCPCTQQVWTWNITTAEVWLSRNSSFEIFLSRGKTHF